MSLTDPPFVDGPPPACGRCSKDILGPQCGCEDCGDVFCEECWEFHAVNCPDATTPSEGAGHG